MSVKNDVRLIGLSNELKIEVCSKLSRPLPNFGESSKLRRLLAKSGEQKAPGRRPRADYNAQSIFSRRFTTVRHLTNSIQAVILEYRKGVAGRRLTPKVNYSKGVTAG